MNTLINYTGVAKEIHERAEAIAQRLAKNAETDYVILAGLANKAADLAKITPKTKLQLGTTAEYKNWQQVTNERQELNATNAYKQLPSRWLTWGNRFEELARRLLGINTEHNPAAINDVDDTPLQPSRINWFRKTAGRVFAWLGMRCDKQAQKKFESTRHTREIALETESNSATKALETLVAKCCNGTYQPPIQELIKEISEEIKLSNTVAGTTFKPGIAGWVVNAGTAEIFNRYKAASLALSPEIQQQLHTPLTILERQYHAKNALIASRLSKMETIAIKHIEKIRRAFAKIAKTNANRLGDAIRRHQKSFEKLFTAWHQLHRDYGNIQQLPQETSIRNSTLENIENLLAQIEELLEPIVNKLRDRTRQLINSQNAPQLIELDILQVTAQLPRLNSKTTAFEADFDRTLGGAVKHTCKTTNHSSGNDRYRRTQLRNALIVNREVSPTKDGEVSRRIKIEAAMQQHLNHKVTVLKATPQGQQLATSIAHAKTEQNHCDALVDSLSIQPWHHLIGRRDSKVNSAIRDLELSPQQAPEITEAATIVSRPQPKKISGLLKFFRKVDRDIKYTVRQIHEGLRKAGEAIVRALSHSDRVKAVHTSAEAFANALSQNHGTLQRHRTMITTQLQTFTTPLTQYARTMCDEETTCKKLVKCSQAQLHTESLSDLDKTIAKAETATNTCRGFETQLERIIKEYRHNGNALSHETSMLRS